MTSPKSSGQALLRGAASCVFALIIALASLTSSPAVGASEESRLAVTAELPVPWAAVQKAYMFRFGGLDAQRRRLYMFAANYGTDATFLTEYDLAARLPRPLRISAASVTSSRVQSPYTVVIDRRRERLLILSITPNESRPIIEVVSLKTMTRVATWSVSTVAPGFSASGLTFDETADRLYLVGQFSGNDDLDTVPRGVGRPAAPGTALIALRASDGGLGWVRAIPECRQVLRSASVGAFIGLSSSRTTLYTFCDGATAAKQVVTGQSGLVRLEITASANSAAAANFPSEFFPVSGQWHGATSRDTGIAGFDSGSERVFVQSLSPGTPGGWVFDGRRRVWVGFVAAPDSNDKFLGVNPKNGRYYLAGSFNGDDGYVNVTDGRATPIAQGTTFTGIRIDSALLADPGSNRLFGVLRTPLGGAEPSRVIPVVLEDRTEAIAPLDAVDYDGLTADLPDSKSAVTFSATSAGFAARYRLVGGLEGAYGRVDALRGNTAANHAFGDRGGTLAEVQSVDVRQSGASATASAAAADDATQADRSDVQQDVKAAGAPHDALSFPYGLVTCLDGIGERSAPREGSPGDTGWAAAVCDLKAAKATGAASFADRVSAGGVTVAGGSFDTQTARDPRRGAVTKSVAVAEGVAMGPAAGPRIAIKRITTTATTVANGRPGSSSVRWSRKVEGVSIVSPDGSSNPAQSCTTTASASKRSGAGDCDELARQINRALPAHIRVAFPNPAAVASPRGAFASVEETEESFLDGLTTNNDDLRAVPGMQAVVYNDGAEKSRLLVQFAATTANSIFTRSPLGGGGFGSGRTANGGGPPAGSDKPRDAASFDASAGVGTGAGTGADAKDSSDPAGVRGTAMLSSGSAGGAPGEAAPLAAITGYGADQASASPAERVLGWLVGSRSPGDAALAAGTWLLFAGALIGIWRRRRLLSILGV